MQAAFNHRVTSNGVDRRKADAIARRIAKGALIKASLLWSQNQYRDFFRTEQDFLNYVYDYTYRTVLIKSINKQKAKTR